MVCKADTGWIGEDVPPGWAGRVSTLAVQSVNNSLLPRNCVVKAIVVGQRGTAGGGFQSKRDDD